MQNGVTSVGAISIYVSYNSANITIDVDMTKLLDKQLQFYTNTRVPVRKEVYDYAVYQKWS